MNNIASRAARHAALGDPARLAIVDELRTSDRMPSELQALVDLPSNLLAHHLDVLEAVGLIRRTRSTGDGRRRYVHLEAAALAGLAADARLEGPALFICTHNSARSPLAAALWTQLSTDPASSAGTHPAKRVHPRAVAAAKRAGLDLSHTRPRHLHELTEGPTLVITVCDRAHEECTGEPSWLHWSIPDPVLIDTAAAFDATVAELRERIAALIEPLRAA